MTHERTLELIDDFVDGALDPRQEREVRRHLMQCDGCRAEERALRALLDDAAALPEEVFPDRDLWAEIAPRLQARTPGAVGQVEPAAPARTLRLPRPLPGWMLAAAAVVLVVASSLATLEFASPRGGSVATLPTEQAAPPASAGGAPTALVAFQPAEQEYERAIGDLTAVLEARRDQLAPETVAVLEENLRVIDRAIAESRAALADDPASGELTRMLADSYNAKLGVLRRAVQL
jgi:anti-sigma factor RsiW